jgi:hypothetical protein
MDSQHLCDVGARARRLRIIRKKAGFLISIKYNLSFSSVIGSCLAIYANAISSLEVRKRILGLLNACLRHESCARDLFLTHNLSTWLVVMARVSYLPF